MFPFFWVRAIISCLYRCLHFLSLFTSTLDISIDLMRPKHDIESYATIDKHLSSAYQGQPTSLGVFAKLPIEIRLMIWQAVNFEFPIRMVSGPKTQASGLWRLKTLFFRTTQRYSQLDILRVSRQIGNEAYCELARYTLCYCFSVRINSTHTIAETIWHIKGYPNLSHCNYRKSILVKLRGIRFVIDAPLPTMRYGHAHQGATVCNELLSCFLQILSAMQRESFSKTDRTAIREITVAFVNRDNRKWQRDRKGDEDFARWRENRYRSQYSSPISTWQGFEWCLQMLLPLAMFERITVEFPEGIVVDDCLRRYIRSRSERDGSKDWVLRTADGKEETLRNDGFLPRLPLQ